MASKWIVLIEHPNCAQDLWLSLIWMAGSLSSTDGLWHLSAGFQKYRSTVDLRWACPVETPEQRRLREDRERLRNVNCEWAGAAILDVHIFPAWVRLSNLIQARSSAGLLRHSYQIRREGEFYVLDDVPCRFQSRKADRVQVANHAIDQLDGRGCSGGETDNLNPGQPFVPNVLYVVDQVGGHSSALGNFGQPAGVRTIGRSYDKDHVGFLGEIEYGPLADWKVVAGGGQEMQDVFWYIKEAIDAYFDGRPFEVTVRAGCLIGHKGEPQGT